MASSIATARAIRDKEASTGVRAMVLLNLVAVPGQMAVGVTSSGTVTTPCSSLDAQKSSPDTRELPQKSSSPTKFMSSGYALNKKRSASSRVHSPVCPMRRVHVLVSSPARWNAEVLVTQSNSSADISLRHGYMTQSNFKLYSACNDKLRRRVEAIELDFCWSKIPVVLWHFNYSKRLLSAEIYWHC